MVPAKDLNIELNYPKFNLCDKGMCMGCIPVEKACLAFGIISAVVTLLTLLASITVGVLIACDYTFDQTHNKDETYKGLIYELYVALFPHIFHVMIGIYSLMLGLTSLIGFIFSVLLCNGICKHRPGQVKAYFVCGVTATIPTVAVALAFVFSEDSVYSIYILVACGIHSLFLLLVHQTYCKLLEVVPTGKLYPDQENLVGETENGGASRKKSLDDKF